MATQTFQELARQYGLPPVPPSVLRLTEMVASQDADLGQVAELIEADPNLRARLLRLANPGIASEADYEIDSVEGALFRKGIGCALLLAMGSPLALAMASTFKTMLSQNLESLDPTKVKPMTPPFVLGAIDFSGKAAGAVSLQMSVESAKQIASRVLGIPASELQNSAEIDDAIGELVNIITGNFKSNLCDAGLDCRLAPPRVWRASEPDHPAMAAGGLERMAFAAPPILLLVNVTINPWNQ